MLLIFHDALWPSSFVNGLAILRIGFLSNYRLSNYRTETQCWYIYDSPFDRNWWMREEAFTIIQDKAIKERELRVLTNGRYYWRNEIYIFLYIIIICLSCIQMCAKCKPSSSEYLFSKIGRKWPKVVSRVQLWNLHWHQQHQDINYPSILPFIKLHSPKPLLAPCVTVPDPFPPVLALPTSLALLPTIGVHPSPLHAHSLGACKTRLDRRIWWTTLKKKNYLQIPRFS